LEIPDKYTCSFKQVSNATLRKRKQRETEAKKRPGNKERKQKERVINYQIFD
jgi:hypothetical protein